MNYDDAIDYLYSATPQFQRIGAAAYKPGLETVQKLSLLKGNPHREYPTVHVGGTNGKGSTSHLLASILIASGYKVGLFTSPHLNDFRERIRINGKMISKADVVDWIEDYISRDTDLEPSFFELTTMMAFDMFLKYKVDIAIVEVGLGGRLDSTNIISPILSIITNVSKDHVAQLGATVDLIAVEKAGIIKDRVPVILGEGEDPTVNRIIKSKATESGCRFIVADEENLISSYKSRSDSLGNIIVYDSPVFGVIEGELTGSYQIKNTNTVLASVLELRRQGWTIPDAAVRSGFRNVVSATGLLGRWTTLYDSPKIIADTGHNEGGWKFLSETLSEYEGNMKIIIGFVNDKDIASILPMLPKNADYYFTQASVPRSMNAEVLAIKASEYSLSGPVFDDVKHALMKAMEDSRGVEDCMIFVGGSTFVVADAIDYFKNR